jgi:hypothetical protein
MPIKVFSAPGDHRDDFETIETQVNNWIESAKPNVVDMRLDVTPLPERRDSKTFMMTIVLRYD